MISYLTLSFLLALYSGLRLVNEFHVYWSIHDQRQSDGSLFLPALGYLLVVFGALGIMWRVLQWALSAG